MRAQTPARSCTVAAEFAHARPVCARIPCDHWPMPVRLPNIEWLRSTTRPRDLVILAHGGSVQADSPARDCHTGLLRVVRFGDIAAGAAPDAAVGLLRYRVSGWNGASADPASDLQDMIDSALDR